MLVSWKTEIAVTVFNAGSLTQPWREAVFVLIGVLQFAALIGGRQIVTASGASRICVHVAMMLATGKRQALRMIGYAQSSRTEFDFPGRLTMNGDVQGAGTLRYLTKT